MIITNNVRKFLPRFPKAQFLISVTKYSEQKTSTNVNSHRALHCGLVAAAPFSSNMNVFKLSDYDCIGFDLDNTLLRYKVTNLVTLEYELLAHYLVTQKGYSPKYLLKPLTDKDLDFMQRGLTLDLEKGNILRLNSSGKIQRASHGTKLLTREEICEIYPQQRWDVTDAYCNNMLISWNGPMAMQMRSLLDYFDIPSSIVFAKLIDSLDEEHGHPLNTYNVWPDVLDGLNDMFNRSQFASTKGGFFSSVQKNPEKYLHKCTANTLKWLRDLKKMKKTFLITGSDADLVNYTASFAFGNDWKSLFDIIVCYAKKPGFFNGSRSFLQVRDCIEGNSVSAQDLQEGEIYSQGNWNELFEFLARISRKDNPQCVYIGDNLIQDIYVPNAYTNCDTIVMVEEQASEGMIHQRVSHPDDKVLNSKFWGSFFCLKDFDECTDSLWGDIITKHSKICIPDINLLTEGPLEKNYESFYNEGKKYSGYYPAMPLSVASL